jgi:uncharacterized protein (TIGR02172 family)
VTKLSITSLGKPIALGRTAKVYAWGSSQVLKLFHDWMPLYAIEYEAQIARAVHTTGLPVPAVGEIVEIGDRLALVYERVDGLPMDRVLAKKPWKFFPFTRLLAQLHVDIHASSIIPDIPAQKRRLKQRIQETDVLPDDLKDAVLNTLRQMPDGERLCHGDFHPQNVLMTQQGPVIIDWTDATRGDPIADVARSSIILQGAALTNPSAGWFHDAYLRRYFKLHRDNARYQYNTWRTIVAAVRLSENVAEQQEWLLAQVRAGLASRQTEDNS